MRKFRKIALMLLVLALSVSCFAVASMATRTVTAANATDLMEYYNAVAINEDFEALTAGNAYTGSALAVPSNHSETLNVVEESGEKALYLYASSTTNAIDTYFVANHASDAKGFGFDFSIKLNVEGKSHTNHHRGKFAVVADTYTATANNTATEIFSMSPKMGSLVVATSTGSVSITEVPIKNNVRYDVSYYCNFETGKFTFTVKWNDGTDHSYTSAELNSGFTSLTSVKFGFALQSINTTKNYIYSIRSYAGSFAQNVMAEDVAATVDGYVQQLVSTYENGATSADDKLKIASVFADLKKFYSYSAQDATLEAKVSAIADSANVAYATALIEGTDAIDTKKPYAVRVAHVESIKKYYDYFAATDSVIGVDTAKFTAAKTAYTAELAAIADTKADSEAVITVIGTMTLTTVENSNYGELKTVYESVKALNSVDSTYSADTAAANIVANAIISKVDAIILKAEKFIDATEVLGTQGVKVGPLYAAYTTATANKDADAAYPGVSAAKSVYDAYDATDLLAQVAVCDKIIAAVSKAEMSNNYASRKALIDSVKTDVEAVDVEALDYPGLEDAVDGYAELVKALASQASAAADYLAAVNELKDCDTFEEIKAAVTAALALKDTGDVEGVEGVKEANSLLAAKESYVNCLEGYSKTFIALVNELKETSDIQLRLDLINEAEAIKASGYDGYTGFGAAVTEFAAQKTAYNNAVNAANSAFKSLVGNAVDSVSSPASSVLAKAAEVVKKILE